MIILLQSYNTNFRVPCKRTLLAWTNMYMYGNYYIYSYDLIDLLVQVENTWQMKSLNLDIFLLNLTTFLTDFILSEQNKLQIFNSVTPTIDCVHSKFVMNIRFIWLFCERSRCQKYLKWSCYQKQDDLIQPTVSVNFI